MKKLKKENYYVQNGHKFFFGGERMDFQCAACLYIQEREFVRNSKGLIIGARIKEESHSSGCFQNES